jgi:hypothetical protein
LLYITRNALVVQCLSLLRKVGRKCEMLIGEYFGLCEVFLLLPMLPA